MKYGIVRAFIYTAVVVLALSPFFFWRAWREVRKDFNFWEQLNDLPNWLVYIAVVLFTLAFWTFIVILLL